MQFLRALGGGSPGRPFVFPACFWSSSIQEGNTKDLAIPLYFLRGFDQPEPRRKYKGLGALKVGVIQEGNTKGLTSFWVVSPYNLQRKIGGRAPPKSKTYSSARPRGRAPPTSKTQIACTTAPPLIWGGPAGRSDGHLGTRASNISEKSASKNQLTRRAARFIPRAIPL